MPLLTAIITFSGIWVLMYIAWGDVSSRLAYQSRGGLDLGAFIIPPCIISDTSIPAILEGATCETSVIFVVCQ